MTGTTWFKLAAAVLLMALFLLAVTGAYAQNYGYYVRCTCFTCWWLDLQDTWHIVLWNTTVPTSIVHGTQESCLNDGVNGCTHCWRLEYPTK